MCTVKAPTPTATAAQGLVLAYTVLAVLTFAELFKVRCLRLRSQPPCVQLRCFVNPDSDMFNRKCLPQVNLVKVPENGRDATKGIATALSMSFSMPPNLVLFLWMLLTKYDMHSLWCSALV